MSEIKGQLLGIILVLMIFGAVVGALVPVVQKMTQRIRNTVGDITELSDDQVDDPNPDLSFES